MLRRAALRLQPHPSQWALLAHAVQHSVPQHGFTAQSIIHAASTLDEQHQQATGGGGGERASSSWAQLVSPAHFPRGYEIALVEHAVILSNLAVKKHLNNLVEEAVSSPATLSTNNTQSFGDTAAAATATASTLLTAAEGMLFETPTTKPSGQQPKEEEGAQNAGSPTLSFPSWRQVVHEGLRTKLLHMQPYAHHWQHAIVLEAYPSNAPYAVKNLALLADDVCYFAERSHRYSIQYGNHQHSLLLGPTSGPNVSLYWYFARAKVMALYGAAVLHLMGDESVAQQDTFRMLDCAVKTAFS